MYPNLKRELTNRKITIKTFAEFLGVSEKTIKNKISGRTEFSYSEVKRISMFLFPEFNLEYLFATVIADKAS